MKYSINTVKSALSEVQTTLHWYLEFAKSPSVVAAPQNLVIRCSTAGVPEVQSEVVPVELQGHKVNYVGKTTKSGQITLQFVEGIDALVASFFLAWEKAKWSGDGSDTAGVQTLTNEVKADIVLTLCSPDDQMTQKYTLIGCIASYTHGMNLGQTADPVQPTVTIDYDDFHVQAGNVNW